MVFISYPRVSLTHHTTDTLSAAESDTTRLRLSCWLEDNAKRGEHQDGEIEMPAAFTTGIDESAFDAARYFGAHDLTVEDYEDNQDRNHCYNREREERRPVYSLCTTERSQLKLKRVFLRIGESEQWPYVIIPSPAE